MQTAIHVLQKSIENIQSEILGTQAKLDQIEETRGELLKDIQFLLGRLGELQTAIATLEGKTNEPVTSKNKKTKR